MGELPSPELQPVAKDHEVPLPGLGEELARRPAPLLRIGHLCAGIDCVPLVTRKVIKRADGPAGTLESQRSWLSEGKRQRVAFMSQKLSRSFFGFYK